MFNNIKVLLFAIGLFVLLGITNIMQYKQIKALQESLRISENNYIAVVDENSRLQELTVDQFRKYNYKLDSIAKNLNIKLKPGVQVVQSTYTYKDTVAYRIEFKDSTIYNIIKGDTLKFVAPKGCFEVSGMVTKQGVDIENVAIKDELTVFVNVKGYDKKFLFFKWKPYYRAVVYSKCNNDTIHVEDYIKIKK